MRRVAMLVDERGQQLGTCVVTDQCKIIRHDDALFVRNDHACVRVGHRASGAIAVVFEYTEPFVRERLDRG